MYMEISHGNSLVSNKQKCHVFLFIFPPLQNQEQKSETGTAQGGSGRKRGRRVNMV
jgi:hypothetical protein